MNIVRRVVFGALVAAGLVVGTATSASAVTGSATAPPAPVTIDFSTPGQGAFDPSYFAAQGVTFTSGAFVGFVQGDDALVPGPVAGRFTRPVSSLSVSFAPAFQGTAEYTLDLYDRSGRRVGRARTTVTQDVGDPANGPAGYVALSVGPVAKGSTSFRLSSRLIRSSSSNITLMEFGVSSLTFTRTACGR